MRRYALLLLCASVTLAVPLNHTASPSSSASMKVAEPDYDDSSMSFFSLLEEVLNDSGTKYTEDEPTPTKLESPPARYGEESSEEVNYDDKYEAPQSRFGDESRPPVRYNDESTNFKKYDSPPPRYNEESAPQTRYSESSGIPTRFVDDSNLPIRFDGNSGSPLRVREELSPPARFGAQSGPPARFNGNAGPQTRFSEESEQTSYKNVPVNFNPHNSISSKYSEESAPVKYVSSDYSAPFKSEEGSAVSSENGGGFVPTTYVVDLNHTNFKDDTSLPQKEISSYVTINNNDDSPSTSTTNLQEKFSSQKYQGSSVPTTNKETASTTVTTETSSMSTQSAFGSTNKTEITTQTNMPTEEYVHVKEASTSSSTSASSPSSSHTYSTTKRIEDTVTEKQYQAPIIPVQRDEIPVEETDDYVESRIINTSGAIAAEEQEDPETLALTAYRRPGLYNVNNGQPFYLEKDPVTGDVDFGTRTQPIKTAAATSDDYFYDEIIDVDGIDRKDGKILSSTNYDKKNPFNNLPLNYNDFNKVHDYSNHKSEYPLISSSYANTKVQGTAGEKQTNHKPYTVTSSSQSPSYYTKKHTASTSTTSTPKYYDYDYDLVTTPKTIPIPNYGDKITKKPTTEVYVRPLPNVPSTYGSNFKKPTNEIPPETYLPNDNEPSSVKKPIVSQVVPSRVNSTSPVSFLPTKGTYVTPVESYEERPVPEDEYEDYDSGAQPSVEHHSVIQNVKPVPISTTTSTTTTEKPKIIGNIVYAETPDRTAIVFSETVTTKAPEPIVTSMPLGNTFQFNRPNLGSQYQSQPPKKDPNPSENVFVSSIEANTGGSFVGQKKKESPYGIFAEEPFRPIYGPDDKLVERQPIPVQIGQNLVNSKIPQETPNRWSYPNAPLNPTFFNVKNKNEEVPPRITGVEPPRQAPATFLQQPSTSNVSPWGNSANSQQFHVSSHVKFPSTSGSIEVSDNIAQEGNVAPTQFNRPLFGSAQRPQNLPQTQNSLIRGTVLPVKTNGIAPSRSPQSPEGEGFVIRDSSPNTQSIGPQRLNNNGYLVREPPLSFNVPVRVSTGVSQGGNGANNVRVEGETFDVPIGISLTNENPSFSSKEQNGLSSPPRETVTGQRPQGGEVNIPTNENTGIPSSVGEFPPGEIPNPPMREIPEGSIPQMDVPAVELQPPRRGSWERPRPVQGPTHFHRKPFNPNRRQGPDNLPNILPQFRPNAKSSHNEGNRIGYFGPGRQPLLERPGRPVLEHLQPPPTRLRNRNDNVDEIISYEKYSLLPPSPMLHRPFVHRRAGPHMDNLGPRPQVTTLQMIQQFPRQPQLPRDQVSKTDQPERPVFVVYPVNSSPNSKAPNPDREVVVGIRGPHLPVPPSNLNTEEELYNANPYQHNKHQQPLLQPSKDRKDAPIVLVPTTRPGKNEFPYQLVEPIENHEHAENEEGNTEVSKSSIDETIEAEVYNNHPPNSEDTEVNVIPYLQDYMPFATKTPTQNKPKEDKPITVADSLWSLFTGNDQEPRIVTKPKEEQISVTLKTVVPTQKPIVYEPTTSVPFKVTDYPRPITNGGKEGTIHQAVVGSEGSEFTLSAVMHTIPQANRHEINKIPSSVVHSSSPNLHLPQNHNNGDETISQNFQAPFVASTSVGATPVSQGWNILAAKDDRIKAGTVDRGDVDSESQNKDIQVVSTEEKEKFDFENFKPVLFGGFKPIYSTGEESGNNVNNKRLQQQTQEREEKKLA